MSKANRLLAAVLAVIMLVSMMTVGSFAAGTKTFADDYEADTSDGSVVVTNRAVLVTSAAKNKQTGTALEFEWDGEEWEFTVGINAFANFNDAYDAADVLADGKTPQLLLGDTKYSEIRIKGPIQLFGVQWNNNPNVVNPDDPSAAWTLNEDWKTSYTAVNDIVIDGAASGEIGIYGVKIIHRFYDIYRPVSAVKTVVTLKNIFFNIEDSSKTVYSCPSTAGGRANMGKTAMSFWNPNSYNTAASAANNKDETHLINFRLGKVDMSGNDNRFIDELISPIFVIDGFCADYANCNLLQFFWAKWRDGMKNCRMELKNSYISRFKQDNRTSIFAFEGFYNNKVVNVEAGESAEIHITNNILCDMYQKNGTGSQLQVYQGEYSYTNISDNLFINTAANGAEIVSFASANAANKTDIKNNTFLGYPSLEITTVGSEQYPVDMTGTHMQASYEADYKSNTSALLPTGNVTSDYCYVDGARTIKSSEVQPFTVDGAKIDAAKKTIEIVGKQGVYYNTPKANGLVETEIYKSDSTFSNYNDSEDWEQVELCTLKNAKNYFLYVVYSPDRTNKDVYKLTVTRPASEKVSLLSIGTDKAITKDGLFYSAVVDKDDTSFNFKPTADTDVTIKVIKDSPLGEVVKANKDGSYTLTGFERGDTAEYIIQLTKGYDSEFITLEITRPYSTECELLSIDQKVTVENGAYVVKIPKGTASYPISLSVSPEASAYVYAGTSVYTLTNGKIELGGIGAGTYKLVVVAEDGVTSKEHTLKVIALKSDEKKVLSVKDATAKDSGFVASTKSEFVVNATVSAGATYKVYEDKDCEYPLEDNTVYIYDEPVTVYIVVTAENGTKSAPVPVTVEYSTAGLIIEGAQKEDMMGDAFHTINLAKDTKSTTLKITADRCTYKLYADMNYTVPATTNVKIDAANVTLYAQVTYPDGYVGYDVINIVSERTPVKYADAASIPNWAKKYVDLVNNSGLGMLQGDEKGNFNAASGMTRYEIAAIATRILGVDASQFASVQLTYADSIAKWAQNYVKAVTKLGIMTGSKNAQGKLEFNGSDTTTRAQLAKVMTDMVISLFGMTTPEFYEMTKIVVDKTYNAYNYADEADIQKWAKPYVKVAVAMGYFQGSVENGRNYFKPNDDIKRQEIAVVLSNFLGLEYVEDDGSDIFEGLFEE